MKLQREETCTWIDVLDRDGAETGRVVPVYIDFTISVDNNYGADADNRRGVRMVEYDIQEIRLDEETARTLLAEEQAQVIRDAEAKFENMDKVW